MSKDHDIGIKFGVVVPEYLITEFEAEEARKKAADLPADPPITATEQDIRFAEVYLNGTAHSNNSDRIEAKTLSQERFVGRSRSDHEQRDSAIKRTTLDRTRQRSQKFKTLVEDVMDYFKSRPTVTTPNGTRLHVIAPFEEVRDLGPRTRIPGAKPGRLSHSAQPPRR